MYAILREILEEGERGWPGSQPFCNVFIGTERVYCPIFVALFLIPFELPERFAQLRRLDSGEGDEQRFDGEKLSWEANDGPHAGYWKTHGVKNHQRGYAKKTSNQKITGFQINTNKTGKPWLIPWQNPRMHKVFWQVRRWVEKYVPIKGPLEPKAYLDAVEPDLGYEERYPHIFPLFRLPPTSTNQGGGPPTVNEVNRFWLALMLEVQTRWNQQCLPEEAETFVIMGKNGQPEKSLYNPHGMSEIFSHLNL
ncbi:VPA1269 family protein [Rhizobium leguminosarum]|uniref:VPA1269 family protein n=1 Tax=Rhizobium leguminosarum TaxID=384 RepID=UPI001FD9692B|nr:VPA1269 family protein [Rhizobium leguminosarum]